MNLGLFVTELDMYELKEDWEAGPPFGGGRMGVENG